MYKTAVYRHGIGDMQDVARRNWKKTWTVVLLQQHFDIGEVLLK